MNKEQRERWEASQDQKNLRHVLCSKCRHKAEEVINAEENVRVGWYCRVCKLFEKTIGRERKVL
jgi:hypothetical protein